VAHKILLKARLTGDEELQAVLKDLGSDQELMGILRPALIESAQPVMVALAANAPRSHGYDAKHRRAIGMIPLNQTMAVSFKKSGGKNSGNSTAVGRVRIGPSYPEGAEAHLTEFGTVQRFAKGDRRIRAMRALAGVKAGGLNRGAVRPQHWMLRTWNAMITPTLMALQQNISARLLKRAAYLEKKYGGGK